MGLPRVLLLYANAGAGHRRAAEAIAEQLQPQAVIAAYDIVGFTHPAFRALYVKGGLRLITRWPRLYDLVYRITNRPNIDRLIRHPRQRAQQLATTHLLQVIHAYHPDVIVSTHFLASELCAARRCARQLTAPLITIVTDFEPHRMWQHPGTDLYCVPSVEAAEQLQQAGIDPASIMVTGIPIAAVFDDLPNRATARDRIQLDPDRPVVLIMGGGLGVGALEQAARALKQQALDAQIVFITGHNRVLRRKLKAMSPDWIVRGFVDNMPDWLAAADVAISKAGGLAASELLAAGVPTIIPLKLAGHEAINARYFASTGAALLVESALEAVAAARTLLHDPVKRTAMIDAARSAARPHAARDVARLTIEAVTTLDGLPYVSQSAFHTPHYVAG